MVDTDDTTRIHFFVGCMRSDNISEYLTSSTSSTNNGVTVNLSGKTDSLSISDGVMTKFIVDICNPVKEKMCKQHRLAYISIVTQ